MKPLVPFVLFLLAACAHSQEGDRLLQISLANESEQELRCLLNFSHWTTIDLPALAPGEVAQIDLWRTADRALYQPRREDGRQMMLETLVCGFEPGWSESHSHISLQPARESAKSDLSLTCQAGEKPDCRW